MRHFFENNKYFLLLVAGFIILELFVNPLGNFPLNDDWSYARAVKVFDESHAIDFGHFPAMTLGSHILWGWFITKIIGFSFFTLRISTLISLLIGIFFLNKLVSQVSHNKYAGLLATLVLLFNPLSFSLSNTFMTDVNFNTILIICLYFIYNFFLTRRLIFYFGFVTATIILLLIRQYGIILPACFIIAAFFSKEKRLFNISLAVVSLIVAVLSLQAYEVYLRSALPEGSTYKFSGNILFWEATFWKNFAALFSYRHKEIVRHLLIYTSPFAIAYLKSSIQRHSGLMLFVLINSAVLTIVFFTGLDGGSENIFSNMMLGPETFMESFNGARHNYFPALVPWFTVVKMLLVFISLFVFSMSLVTNFAKPVPSLPREAPVKIQNAPAAAFLISFVVIYVFLINITESFFDRYHLPLVTVGIILAAWLLKNQKMDLRLALAPLLLMAWISVAGTKDYLEWNRQRFKAYNYVRQELKIPREKINGGFELTCWNEGELAYWRDFFTTESFDYVIQFNPAKGFIPLKEFEFQRYFPYRKDKIVLSVRRDSL